jgi:predicted nucleotidyltransferase component of viral defense system
MISKTSFSRDWIFKQRDTYPKADPQLIERQIFAFELVGLLTGTGKEFVFKGGTSLLLLLPEAHRLSIDVDIVGDFSIEELERMIRDSVFIHVEEDEREKKGIPKKHFKFYYTSVIDAKPSYVLLDVLKTEHGYPLIQKLPIKHSLFNVDYETTVAIPTVEGILGDKLTAFAPETIGVPFGKNKSMEIIKQLFDVGELFDVSVDLDRVKFSYTAIHRQETSFRNKKFSIEETTQDTINNAFLLCQSRLRGAKENEKSIELQQGIRQIQSYMLGTLYRIEEARVSAAKAAFLSAIIRMNKKNLILKDLRYDESKISQIKDAALADNRQILNRLKSTQTEAFYYWWLIEGMGK